MQSVFTYAIEFTFYAFAAHMTIHFVTGLVARRDRKSTKSPDQRIVELYEAALQDDDDWLAEVTQPSFIPNPEPSTDATPEDAAMVDSHTAFIADYWQQQRAMVDRQFAISDVVVPFRRRQSQAVAVDYSAMSPYELRKLCQSRGIRWRNAHGKNRHLTKAQMLEALQQQQAA